MAETGTDIQKAKLLLQQNELVAIPTETVYGLAANALDPIAVAKIFEAKQRPTFDPLIVHTFGLSEIEAFTTGIHPVLRKLAETFWPGPLTLLLPKKSNVPDLTTSGLDRVGVRVPDHELTLALLRELQFPLAAPSANPFGYISPTAAEHVNKQLGDKIRYILDGGPCRVGLESTIVGEENGEIIVYRLGGLSIDAIERVAGKVSVQLNQSSNPNAPGQLKSHYAPVKPVVIGNMNALIEEHKGKKIAVLSFGNFSGNDNVFMEKNLSAHGDLREAAANLFSYLRLLDESEADVIITNFVPAHDLGLAINDRLKRAAAKN